MGKTYLFHLELKVLTIQNLFQLPPNQVLILYIIVDLILLSNILISFIFALVGNYLDSLSDAKAAIELQPNFLKAIIQGETSRITTESL